MAYSISKLKTNVEAMISSLGPSPSVKELTVAAKSAQGLNCSNYNVLEAAVQAKIDAQTTGTPSAEIMLASLLVGATNPKVLVTEEVYVVVASDAAYPVPENATACFVTYGSSGGNSYQGYTVYTASGGGGGGSKVVDFPVGITAGGTLKIVLGSITRIDELVITSGANAIYRAGGAAGTVTYLGVPQSNSDTVILGGKGGNAGGTNDQSLGSDPNALAEDGEDAGGFFGGTAIASRSGGGGGGASYGGDGGKGGVNNITRGERPVGIYGSGGGGDFYNTSVYTQVGGTNTDITLKFIIETVVE